MPLRWGSSSDGHVEASWATKRDEDLRDFLSSACAAADLTAAAEVDGEDSAFAWEGSGSSP